VHLSGDDTSCPVPGARLSQSVDRARWEQPVVRGHGVSVHRSGWRLQVVHRCTCVCCRVAR